jgi:hypothetical protein
MSTQTLDYQQQLLDEIGELPNEYLPNLLQIVRLFRESVTLKPAEAGLRQGLHEALSGEVRPVSELWEGVDAE